jgi:tetratricopeptide (TPR) repeat protein
MRQIGASLFAVRQFPDYSYSQIRLINSWTSGTLWLAITGLGLIFGVVLGARKHIPVLFGAVFAATAYLPHSNLLFAADAIRDNSSTYLPSIGTAVLLGGLFEILWHALAPIQKRMQVVVVSRRQIALIGVVALAGVVCMATDVRESRYWRNDRQLAAISVRRAPRSARAHYYSGWVAAQADEVEETEHQYQLALVIYPDYADAWGSLGDVLLAQGEIPQALSCFRHAYDLDPTEARFLALCDTALQTCKYAREAPSVIADRLADGLTDDLRAALKVDLAVAYLRLGHNTSASNILNDVLELHPSNALARFYYSQALRSRGLTGQADAELHLARELDGPAVEKAISRTPQLIRN